MGQSSPTGARRGYASGLDGIRALAVIAVILFHAGVPGLRGGFVGVDVFFVVSGYLVTALLQREHDRTGTIRFGSFFRRRARRLLPALVLMVTVVSAATLALGHDLGAGLRGQLLGAFTFSSNWMQIGQGTSYVSAAEPAVLTHLWSLAVEEQFYLLWPAVCILLLTLLRRRQRRVALVVALALASAIAMAATFHLGADPTRSYEGTDTHGFGLLLGAALAFARRSSDIDPVKGRRRTPLTGLSAAAGPVSLLVVVAGAALLTDTGTATYRGELFAVNVAAMVLVAVTVRGVGAIPTLLSLRLLRGIGRRSYALYLWHWPALVIADRVLTPSIGHPGAAAVAIAAALVATEMSWRWVELPIRRHGVGGYLRNLRKTLAGHQPVARRRTVGWVAAGSFGLVLGVAACSVVVAPQESQLAVSLAAGEAALAQASLAQTSAAPDSVSSSQGWPSSAVSTTSAPPVVTVPPLGSSSTPAPGASSTRAIATTTTPTDRTLGATPSRAGPRSPVPAVTPALHAGAAATRQDPGPATKLTTKPVPPPVTGAQISAIGDSVMLASAPALLARFGGADIDAVVSRQIWDLGSLIGVKVAAGSLRPALVIGLGTNGTDSAQHIAAALAQLPAGEVVILVNSFVPDAWQDEVNTNLQAVASARPHTCTADWHAAIGAHRDLLGPDGVHPGAAGGQLYATVVAEALRRCQPTG